LFNLFTKALRLSIFSCFLGIAGNASAALITIPLNYTTSALSANPALRLSGTLVLDTNGAGSASRDQLFAPRNNPQVFPAWVSTLNFTVTDTDLSDGDQGFSVTKDDFNLMVWAPKPANISNVDFNSDLVSQFDDISFFSFAGQLTTASPMQADSGGTEFNLTSTPSPLLYLGFLPILYYSRKLKNITK